MDNLLDKLTPRQRLALKHRQSREEGAACEPLHEECTETEICGSVCWRTRLAVHQLEEGNWIWAANVTRHLQHVSPSPVGRWNKGWVEEAHRRREELLAGVGGDTVLPPPGVDEAKEPFVCQGRKFTREEVVALIEDPPKHKKKTTRRKKRSAKKN